MRCVRPLKSMNYIILNLSSRDGLSLVENERAVPCPDVALDQVVGRQRQDLKENFISLNAEFVIAIFTQLFSKSHL